MAINKATLAKEVDGKVEYIYPKTTADLVEYDSTQTVEQKLQSIDKDVAAVDKRVDTLSKGVSSGSVSTTSDAELFDIRNPNRDVVGTDVTYDSAGAAVRGQIGALSDEIENKIGELYKGAYYEEFAVNGDTFALSDGNTFAVKTTVSDLAADGINKAIDLVTQRILDSIKAAITLNKEYTESYVSSYFTDHTENVLELNPA